MSSQYGTGSIRREIIKDASARFAKNEATDADRIILVLDSHGAALERIEAKVDSVKRMSDMFLADRKRVIAAALAVMGGGAGLGGGIVGFVGFISGAG